MSVTFDQAEISLINGKNDNSLLFEDRGFNYGDGLFETMLCRDARIPLKTYHIERLERGCEHLAMDLPVAEIESQLAHVCEHMGPRIAIVRLQVTRKTGSRGSYPLAGSGVNIFLKASPLREDTPQPHGKSLFAASCPLPPSGQLLGLKHTNRLAYIQASLGRHLADEDEIYFCDDGDNIVETMHHNIFFVRKSTLYTPSLARCGVHGVMRRLVIEVLARQLTYNVVEAEICQDEIDSFAEVFITNAVRGVIPVVKIDGHVFTDHRVAKRLQSALMNLYLTGSLCK